MTEHQMTTERAGPGGGGTQDPDTQDWLLEDPAFGELTHVLVSVVSPTRTNQRGVEPAVKVWGCFGSAGEAAEHARGLQTQFDLYILQMGKWALAPPDPAQPPAEAEAELQGLVRSYMQDLSASKEDFLRRKDELMSNPPPVAAMPAELQEVERALQETAQAPFPAGDAPADAAPDAEAPPAREGEEQAAGDRRAPRLDGQQFIIVAFAAANGAKEPVAFKCRQCCASMQEATEGLERLKEVDANFDNMVLQMYGWAPIPPDPMQIENTQYREPFMQDLMGGYQESQKNAKKFAKEAPAELQARLGAARERLNGLLAAKEALREKGNLAPDA